MICITGIIRWKLKYSDIKFDCRFFKSEFPCVPNKLRGKICVSCDEYIKISKRILIIKLGAIGDVLRTTPLVLKYRKMFPDCEISWITNFPDILSGINFDNVYKFEYSSISVLLSKSFDIAVNLDKDKEACILLNQLKSKLKYGFSWEENKVKCLNEAVEMKYLTGLFDQLSIANTQSYQQEIFSICDLIFDKEEYILNIDNKLNNKWEIIKKYANGKKIIGLNTGCGKRWITRKWPGNYWIKLIILLKNNNYYPVLLGGPDEDFENRGYSEKTDSFYPGTFSLEEFVAITNQCDVIVSAVTMMMHIAIGLKKNLILFNNIFNKNEFELYGRGIIMEPSSGCDCYYGLNCKRNIHCMLDILPEDVFNCIKNSAGS